jgi:hypothetical protein
MIVTFDSHAFEVRMLETTPQEQTAQVFVLADYTGKHIGTALICVESRYPSVQYVGASRLC